MATPTQKLNAPASVEIAGTKHISNQRFNAIVERFNSRCEAQGYKGAKRKAACLEYYVGAMAALSSFGYILPPGFVFPIMRGDEPTPYTSKKGGK